MGIILRNNAEMISWKVGIRMNSYELIKPYISQFYSQMLLLSRKRLGSTFHSAYSISQMENISESVVKNYQEAIKVLNLLQSNRNVLNSVSSPNTKVNYEAAKKLEQVKKFVFRSGLTLDDISKLPVIHVSGTKGKGSTCAYCESILRHHGYKTGFFSSPHLIEVRERIRVNGVPITKDSFSKYFWNIHNILIEHKESPGDMPFYFQFLFIMALHIFLQEKVDVAIIEVGIGGEYDPTNIVTNVPVAAITSLGYDHTIVLGNSIENISWNKSGIMKEGSRVFTVSQPESAYDVMFNRSIEKQCSLSVIESNNNHILPNVPFALQTNINLAIKMAETWMFLYPKNQSNVDRKILEQSIDECIWPGRYEIKQTENIRFYIDGAHTLESIALCVDWFLNDVKTKESKRALIFNLTGGRCCEEFFKLFLRCEFQTVLFVPNVARSSGENAGGELSNCCIFKNKWMSMYSGCEDVEVLSSVQDAIDYLGAKGRYNLLVTGSLYLVGAVSSLLNPDLNGSLKNVGLM